MAFLQPPQGVDQTQLGLRLTTRMTATDGHRWTQMKNEDGRSVNLCRFVPTFHFFAAREDSRRTNSQEITGKIEI
jgi:hypothetical protein